MNQTDMTFKVVKRRLYMPLRVVKRRHLKEGVWTPWSYEGVFVDTATGRHGFTEQDSLEKLADSLSYRMEERGYIISNLSSYDKSLNTGCEIGVTFNYFSYKPYSLTQVAPLDEREISDLAKLILGHTFRNNP